MFLQVGFQRLSYEMREDVPSYGSESLFGELSIEKQLFIDFEFFKVIFIVLITDAFDKHLRIKINDKNFE